MKFNTLTALLTLLVTGIAHAENAPTSLDKLYPGYSPTVFSSYADVDTLFKAMPVGFRGAQAFGLIKGSECYHRAEIWSYNFSVNQNIKVMKVFVFYTHEFKKQFKELKGKKFTWHYHVAPYVLVQDHRTNKLEERVIDPTFAKTPQTMREWTDMFVETHKKCAEFIPYEQFKNEVEPGPKGVYGTEHCYLVRTPAMDFEPNQAEARSNGTLTTFEWDRSQVEEALDSAPTRKNYDQYRAMLGFHD